MKKHVHNKYILYTIIFLIIIAVLPLFSAAEECKSCHKIRHGSTDDLCNDCHSNTTVLNGKHEVVPFSPGYVHDSFDWEGDNMNEKGQERLNESCPVCHVSMMEHEAPVLNICEDCHVKGTPRISVLAVVRPNLTSYIPKVYSHFNGSSIEVQSQSSIGNTRSSCFGLDPATGEGSCHGVTYANKANVGGYFAINNNYTGALNRGDPYHWNAPVDFLPDSKDCVFCHLQEDTVIRKAWGNPLPLPSDSSHVDKKNNDCWNCHVNGQLINFHGKEVIKIKEKSYTIYIISAFVLLLILTGFYIWKRKM